jgi:KaiC/GvpD/RAD55 family RecA-like ATPase
MFRETIEGLDQIFETDIRSRKTLLVTGGGGTLKTTFVYNLLSCHLTKTGEVALYITLEESEDSILENIQSINAPICKNIHIVDYNILRLQFKDKEKDLEFAYVLETLMNSFKKEYPDKFKYVALDSLGALYSLIKISDIRSDIYHFFSVLKQLNLTALIIAEEIVAQQSRFGYEDFLTDGMVELGILEMDGQVKRYIQVKKMRTVKHHMEKFELGVGDNGLVIVGPLFS